MNTFYAFSAAYYYVILATCQSDKSISPTFKVLLEAMRSHSKYDVDQAIRDLKVLWHNIDSRTYWYIYFSYYREQLTVLQPCFKATIKGMHKNF